MHVLSCSLDMILGQKVALQKMSNMSYLCNIVIRMLKIFILDRAIVQEMKMFTFEEGSFDAF